MIGKSRYVYDTPAATNEWTERAKLHVAVLQERLDNCTADKERGHRMARLECPSCWYLTGGMSGQAFTKYTCQVCEKEDHWANASTPRVCWECAKRLNICCHCGADLDFKNRRVTKGAGR